MHHAVGLLDALLSLPLFLLVTFVSSGDFWFCLKHFVVIFRGTHVSVKVRACRILLAMCGCTS